MAVVLFRRHNSILLAGLLGDSQSHKVKKKTKPYLGAKSGLQATKLPSLKVSKMYITVMWAVCLPCECTSDWRVVKEKCCECLRVSVEESSFERCHFIRQDLRRPRVATLSPRVDNDGMCTAIREASFNHSFVLAALLLQITLLRGSKSESVVFHQAIVW